MDNSVVAILFMDDELYVREIASAMLQLLGSSVTTCSDGADAVEHYRAAMESGNPFDLVIMDLVVPDGLGGIDAAREILQLDPNAKLVASSGYSHEPVMANPNRYGFRACLPKPYTIFKLIEVLETLRRTGGDESAS